MSKNRALTSNNNQNVLLNGLNSIQVGLYLLLFSFIFKSLLDAFLSDVSMLGMMSIEIIEWMGSVLFFLFILLSGMAVLFSSKRLAKRSGYLLMNQKTQKQCVFYLSNSLIAFFALYALMYFGYSMYVGIGILLSMGLILLILNSQKKKAMYLLAATSLLLALISYLIPNYWYSSFMIMGVAFIVYGMIHRK